MPAQTRFGLDTSCLIPLLAEWHAHHDRTTRSYRTRLARGERPVIAIHALLESYSVLTRLPHPVRIEPSTVEQVLTRYFVDAEIAGITANLCWRSIRSLADLNIGGGKIYDAVIAFTVADAGAAVLLTFNVKDFLAVSPRGLQLSEP
jgi:predicted nucleic acid-binding protein